MSLDTYTQNIPLTQKARFWSNYVAALKGTLDVEFRHEGHHRDSNPHLTDDTTLYDILYRSQDLRAPDEAALRTWHPSIIETLPNEFPDLKHEFGKLESQMFDRPRRRGADPLSPVLPDARDRIFSLGYNYCPVHTEIYGTYRARVPARRDGLTEELGSSQDPLAERPGVMTFGSAYPYYYGACRAARAC